MVETNQDVIDKLTKNVNYIIKASVTENGIISSNGKIVLKGETLGKAVIGGETYTTAHQGETITINVQTVDGYKYSLSNGEALLTADNDGSYTLKIPAGGGVDLKAVLEKIEEKKSESKNDGSSSDSGKSDTDSNSSSTGSGTNSGSNSSSSASGSSSGSGSNSGSNSGRGTGSSSGGSSGGSGSNGGSGSGGSGGGGGGGGLSGISAVASAGVQTGMANTAVTLISTPGTWTKDAAGNWIYADNAGKLYKNDWIAAGNRWYYLNENGNPVVGWQLIKDVWYYFSSIDTTDNPFGAMYAATTTPDGYKVDADGKYTV